MTGRTNAGSGGKMKILSGSVSVKQTTGSVIAELDFKPLMIFTFTESGEYENGFTTDTEPSISIRASATDEFATYSGSTLSNKLVARHTYDEATGQVTYRPSPTDSTGSNTVFFRIMGV